MQRFILEENIRKFEKLLEAETHEEARLPLQRLLRSAQQQLALLITSQSHAGTASEAGHQFESSADEAMTRCDQEGEPRAPSSDGRQGKTKMSGQLKAGILLSPFAADSVGRRQSASFGNP